MADVQKTLEIIFMEAAKVFGKDESQSLLNKVFETTTKVIETKVVEKKKKSKKEESTKVAETKVEESTKVIETEVKAGTTKRIGRMTQTIANKLKAELVKAGVVFSDNEEKELANFKKKFVSYVDELTNDDFTKKGLEKHMEDFASTHKPASATTAVSTEAEKPTSVLAGPSNIAHIEDLTLKQLQAIENIATPSGGAKGVYWDCDNGRWVRGPDRDDDEELTETTFQDKTYGVGENTGRIYEITDNKDIFVGFIGIGSFDKMKI